MRAIKILNTLITMLILLCFIVQVRDVQAQGVKKQVMNGYIMARMVDSGDEGEGSMGWDASGPLYWNGYENGLFSSKAFYMGCKSFTDTNGVVIEPKLTGHGQWENDDRHILMPIPDAQGNTIHRYLRYQPPDIIVDGLFMNAPYPFNISDHIDASKIPGTADNFFESWIRSDMGVSIHQRGMYFSQANHEKYFIRSMVFKNTGNVDLDDEVEKPNQVIEDFYVLKQVRPFEDPRPWVGAYGDMPGDSLRMVYGYPHRLEGSAYDNFGDPDEVTGFMYNPRFNGEAILFASASADNPTTDDENQPTMTGFHDVDLPSVTVHSWNQTSQQARDLYTIMSEGFMAYDGQRELQGAKPGNHMAHIDDGTYAYITDLEWLGYSTSAFWACGPYQLDPGDSIIIITADLMGAISPVKAAEVGAAWVDVDDQATPPPGMTFSPRNDNLPQQYYDFPELMESDQHSTENNWAKDCWVYTGLDSLHKAAAAAQWAVQNDFNVPAPPPPPSLTITSKPNSINVEWGMESETASDFAGYRVYRAESSWFPVMTEDGELIGNWELIYECGDGTDNPLTRQFDDNTAVRGFSYFYYVTAFDDGEDNPPDFDGKRRQLESSRFWNMTQKAARLQRPGGTLNSIAIVPNPFNFSGAERIAHYPRESRDDLAGNQISFLDVPETCTIKIFTESGDLIKTINHSGSGDAYWSDLNEESQATDTGQIVVSGIYIAVFETPDGEQAVKKFVIIR